MGRNIAWVIAVIAMALLQTTWPDMLKLQGVVPDLSLALVVYFAIADGEERAMITGLLSGIYLDTACHAVLGHHVLCLVLVGYLVGRLSSRLITEHPAVKAALVFCAALVHGLLYMSVLYVQQPDFGLIYRLVTTVVPGAFYTGLITPIEFFVLDRVFRREGALQGGVS